MTLSSRIEAGTAEQQRELLEEADAFIFGPRPGEWPTCFQQLLDVGSCGVDEGFTGAAMTLIPDEWGLWRIQWGGGVRATITSDFGAKWGIAGTPALAIAAACVKAKEIERG